MDNVPVKGMTFVLWQSTYILKNWNEFEKFYNPTVDTFRNNITYKGKKLKVSFTLQGAQNLLLESHHPGVTSRV